MMYDVTVIGEMYQDHVFSGFTSWPAPGEEIFTDAYEWELGGGAVITACALARLGRSVQLIGVVGESDMPRIQSRLRDFGVGTQNVAISRLRSGVTVSISTMEDRSFFTYRGANTELEGQLWRNKSLLEQAAMARHIHLALPISSNLATLALPLLCAQGATTSLDVGHHVGWFQDAASLQVLRSIDYTMPNAKEASLLSGSPAGYLAQCRDMGLRHAVVKLGPNGAAMLQNGVEYRTASPDVHVVDTTGAGDVFDAGFIDALLDCGAPQELIDRACICGALSTKAPGALRSLPTRAEMNTLLQEMYAT